MTCLCSAHLRAGAQSVHSNPVRTHTPPDAQGGGQLAADAEYFCNVMSALHVAPPASLLTVQVRFSCIFVTGHFCDWGDDEGPPCFAAPGTLHCVSHSHKGSDCAG